MEDVAEVSGIEDALHDCGITIAEIPITLTMLAELIRASSAARK
jgi:2-keto-3-deoxy-6-phosphogluconate aldolase